MVFTYHFCLWAVLLGLSFESASGLDLLKVVTSRLPKLNARIEKLVQCDDFLNTTLQFEDMVINQIGFNKFSVWGRINVKETFDRPVRLESEMSQCSSNGDTSNCEYYFTYKKSKICELMELGDKSWDYFTKYTDLPKRCPFPPKMYYVNGSVIDLQSVDYLPFFESYWRIKNKGFQDDKVAFCVWAEFSLKMTMNH